MANALINIAGVDLPTPSTYIGTEATLVDSARNVEGYTTGAVIRESVAKVEATWRYLSSEQWSSIMKLFNTRYGGNFYNDVTFFNQLTNDWETREMYVGDRTSAGAFKCDPETGAIVGYTGCKISLVEV